MTHEAVTVGDLARWAFKKGCRVDMKLQPKKDEGGWAAFHTGVSYGEWKEQRRQAQNEFVTGPFHEMLERCMREGLQAMEAIVASKRIREARSLAQGFLDEFEHPDFEERTDG